MSGCGRQLLSRSRPMAVRAGMRLDACMHERISEAVKAARPLCGACPTPGMDTCHRMGTCCRRRALLQGACCVQRHAVPKGGMLHATVAHRRAFGAPHSAPLKAPVCTYACMHAAAPVPRTVTRQHSAANACSARPLNRVRPALLQTCCAGPTKSTASCRSSSFRCPLTRRRSGARP